MEKLEFFAVMQSSVTTLDNSLAISYVEYRFTHRISQSYSQTFTQEK